MLSKIIYKIVISEIKCILVSPEGVAAKKYNEMKNNEVSCISKIICFDSLIFSCSPSRLTD